MLFSACFENHLRAEHARSEQRPGHRPVPEGFEDDGAVHRRNGRATVLFRQHHAEPADFCGFLDELRLKSLLVLVPLGHLVRRHFRFDEILRDLFKFFLGFG